METKKLNINKLSDFPVISEQEQMAMKGGWTLEAASAMIDNGTWQGGYVDGLGYVSAATNVYGGNILPYANYSWTDSDNETYKTWETLYNTGVMIWNGTVWVWNRTGAQW